MLSAWLNDVAVHRAPAALGEVCVNVTVGADASYVLAVGATDAAGNVAANASVAFVLDRQPPVCSYSMPPPPFVSNSSVWLPLSFADTLSPVSLSERVDGGAAVTARVNRMFEGLSDGMHTWSLLCVDGAGNAASQWLSVNTTVDTIPPVVWVPVPPPPYSANATAVRVCRSDTNAGTLSAWLNDVVVHRAPAAPGEVCVNVTVGADASYVLVVGATDAAGNVAANASVAFVLDRQPPVCSYSVPPPPFVSNSSVWLPLSFADTLSPVSLSERVDGGAAVTARVNRLFEGLPDGVHTWSLLCVDGAGNAASQWLSVNTTVDTTIPNVTFASLPAPFVNVTVVRVCVSVVDANSVSLDLSSVGGSVAVAASTALCWQLTASADGNHSVVVTSVDAAGNAGVPLHAWFVVDTVAPVHSAALRNDTRCVVGAVVVCSAVTVDVSCASGPSASSVVQSVCHVDVAVVLLRRVSTSAQCAVAAVSPLSSNATVNTAALQWESLPAAASSHVVDVTVEGLYVVYLRAADGAGNVGATANVTLWLDTSPPTSPPTLTRSPDAVMLSTDAVFEMRGVDDGSPGQNA
jgi:hypothetical protein